MEPLSLHTGGMPCCKRRQPRQAHSATPSAKRGVVASACYKRGMSGVLQLGRNCWRIERVDRFALLVDGADYYTTLAKAIRGAKRWIALLAWDLDTRTQLVERDPGQRTGSLQQFLRDTVEPNPNLHISISFLGLPDIFFANVRDPKLVHGDNPFEHSRICFKSDDVHPPGASITRRSSASRESSSSLERCRVIKYHR